jgi:competence protein ComEA
MEPTERAPWRVLEAPGTTAEDADRPGRPPGIGRSGVGEQASILPRLLLLGVLAVGCAVGAVALAAGTGSGSVTVDGGATIPISGSSDEGSATGDVAAIGGDLVVEIVGAVKQPGVYRLPAGARVGDLVRVAGGYGPRVDTALAEQALNLAAPLRDGEQVRIPSRDDTGTEPGAGGSGTGASAPTPLVDLNGATQAELEALPGIGPATAAKIIAAREEAPFAAVEELRSRGILGEKTFEKLRDLVTVG